LSVKAEYNTEEIGDLTRGDAAKEIGGMLACVLSNCDGGMVIMAHTLLAVNQ
jgi:hypothetical protein